MCDHLLVKMDSNDEAYGQLTSLLLTSNELYSQEVLDFENEKYAVSYPLPDEGTETKGGEVTCPTP